MNNSDEKSKNRDIALTYSQLKKSEDEEEDDSKLKQFADHLIGVFNQFLLAPVEKGGMGFPDLKSARKAGFKWGVESAPGMIRITLTFPNNDAAKKWFDGPGQQFNNHLTAESRSKMESLDQNGPDSQADHQSDLEKSEEQTLIDACEQHKFWSI